MPTSDVPKCPNCRAPWLPGAKACPFCQYQVGKSGRKSARTSDTTQESRGPKPATQQRPIVAPPRGDSLVWTSKTGQVHKRFQVPPSGIVLIGRGQDSDVRLPAKLVSRKHARIEWDGSAYHIRDEHSTNGTSLNNRLVGPTPTRLNYGDQIRIGQEYLFLLAPGQPVPTPLEFYADLEEGIEEAPQRGRVRAGSWIDDYYLKREIGRGGVSIVYEAESKHGEIVALKFPKTTKIHDPALLEMFEHEYRISRDYLNHENIVKVYRLGHYDGDIPYIVMECVPDGWSVYKRLREVGGALPARECQDTLTQTCRALGHAHHQAVIHRDIKPGNILLTPEHQVKLCDFGIARLGVVREFGRAGTYKYMSPEQVRGDEVDARSDIYSLGAVMYEMYAGRPPFEGTDDEIMESHLEVTPRPPHELNRRVPEPVEDSILRALEKDPDDRYADIEEMLDELGWREVATNVRGGRQGRRDLMPEEIDASLEILDGPFAGRTLQLSDVSLLLDRGNVNPMDSTISRQHHAWVYLSEGTYWLEDLKAKNRSIYGGEVIDGPTPLQNGDIFGIGETSIRYRSRV